MDFEVVRVPGKSTLQDYANGLPEADMQKVLATLHTALADEDKAEQIGMEAELESVIACVDSTCLKANVHFPTDWVLLRDAVHTLVQSILVIRKHGMRERIPAAEGFLREINRHLDGDERGGPAQAGIEEGAQEAAAQDQNAHEGR